MSNALCWHGSLVGTILWWEGSFVGEGSLVGTILCWTWFFVGHQFVLALVVFCYHSLAGTVLFWAPLFYGHRLLRSHVYLHVLGTSLTLSAFIYGLYFELCAILNV